MLVELSIQDFSRVLGSDAPAPGGGSVAALSGALGADLVCMVCSLSIGKPESEPHRQVLSEVLSRAKDLSKSLMGRVDRDTQAFNAVMAAFKLPKTTDEEKRTRSEAIQRGYHEAVLSPLGIVRECVEVLVLADRILGKSNPNALSDLGVAAQQAYAGVEGAIMNVKINLPSIKDETFKGRTSSEIAMLLKDARRLRDNVCGFVGEKIG